MAFIIGMAACAFRVEFWLIYSIILFSDSKKEVNCLILFAIEIIVMRKNSDNFLKGSEKKAVVITSDFTDDKNLEERLLASELKYRTFFENSLDAIMITSQDGSIHAANPAASLMLGWTEEEICRLGRKGIVEKTPELVNGLRIRKESGRFFGELVFVKKDGTRFPVEVTSSVFTNSDGCELTTIIARDITDRKITEKAFKESEERLRMASKASGFGTYSYEYETGKVFYSDEFLELYGLLPSDTIDLDSDLIPKALYPGDRHRFLEAMRESNDPLGSGIFDIEFRIIIPDEEIRWLRLRGLTIFTGSHQNDRPLYANGIIQDITTRKVIEESLAESIALHTSIIDSTTDLIWSVDAEKFSLMSFNKAIDSFFKSEGIQIKKGMPLSEIVPAGLAKKLDQLYSQTLREGSLVTQYKTSIHNSTLLINLNVLTKDSRPYAISVFAKDITENKIADEKLKASEAEYRSLFENSLLGISQTLPDGRLVRANTALANIIGYHDPAEMVDYLRNIGEQLYYKPSDRKIFLQRLDRDSIVEPSIFEMKHRSGKIIHVMMGARKITGTDGKLLYIQAEYIDMTQRRLAEIALSESEARYRSLFENSPIGIAATNISGNLLYANLPFARMYGYDDPVKMIIEVSTVQQLFPDQASRANILDSLHQYGKFDGMEMEMLKRDGSKFFVLASAVEVRDTEGNLLYFQSTHIDLTERKKTEERIRAASLYSRTLIEASLDPLVTINSVGKITDVNLATEQITGIKRENLIGSDFANYFLEAEKAREGYNTVFHKGMVKNFPLTIRHKNGRTKNVLYNATLFKNEAGEVQGVFATARDITVRKNMEAKLRASKRMLERLNQHLHEIRENERSQLALNLHDDLGQRLTALYLDISWIKSRIGVQSQNVRLKIDEVISEINDTIDSVKEISSFLRPSILFDLGLVPAIATQLKKFEVQAGIKCFFNYDPDELEIDEKISLILYRIIQESLTNIARHSGASALALSLKKLKSSIELIIKDNGIGIDKEKVKSLTSMGLEGIRERVKSAHGEVIIKGEEGAGTTIKVKIPLKSRKK